ncbi:hypothetical protein DY037_05250 [Apilactobacillus micheneri]|uniref:hypothetical protein n=1 Tax=Apilactobacillus micheneri TaxID=1899430 RepID=UPI00112A000F|nr:hypothetical protein [Apilactobacillus micheneri]TPR49186.1 hypothetical protein DY037_05250 [Apilactobacillus micheneri]
MKNYVKNIKIVKLENTPLYNKLLNNGFIGSKGIDNLKEFANHEFLDKVNIHTISASNYDNFLYEIEIDDDYSIITDDGQINEIYGNQLNLFELSLSKRDDFLIFSLFQYKVSHNFLNGIGIVVKKENENRLSQISIDYIYNYVDKIIKLAKIYNDDLDIINEKNLDILISKYVKTKFSYSLMFTGMNDYPLKIQFSKKLLGEHSNPINLYVGKIGTDKIDDSDFILTDMGSIFSKLKDNNINIYNHQVKRAVCNIINKYMYQDIYSYYDIYHDKYDLGLYGKPLSISSNAFNLSKSIKMLLNCIISINSLIDIFKNKPQEQNTHIQLDKISFANKQIDKSEKVLYNFVLDNENHIDKNPYDYLKLLNTVNKEMVNLITDLATHIEYKKVNDKCYQIRVPHNFRYGDYIELSIISNSKNKCILMSDNGKTIKKLKEQHIDFKDPFIIDAIDNIIYSDESSCHTRCTSYNVRRKKLVHDIDIKRSAFFKDDTLMIELKGTEYISYIINDIKKLNVLIELKENIY